MKRHWKIIIIFLAVLLALACVWVETLGTTQEKAVAAYKKSLLARGEKLDITEVIPPPLPPAQNGADIFNDAESLATPEGQEFSNIAPAMRMIAPGKAMVGFAQPDLEDSDLKYTNTWSYMTTVAQDDRPSTELLARAAAFPGLDFHINYTAWPNAPLEYLAPLKRAAQRLSTAAICNLHNGDTASAATNICAMIGLVNAEQDDRFLICQLVRFAMAAITVSANWELLQATNVNDAQLAMLQKQWEQSDYVSPVENSFLMERAASEMTIDKMRTSSEYFEHTMKAYAPSPSSSGPGSWLDGLQNFWDDMKFGYAKTMWRATWTYSDELRMLQGDQILLEIVRTIEANGCFNPAYNSVNTQLSSLGITNDDSPLTMEPSDIHWLFADNSLVLSSVLRRAMMAETERNVVITAIALKRYQLKNGGYPDTLSQLIPQFLPAVLADPVDGKPLRYRLIKDGTYLLYSIGNNDKDDGGNPALDISVTGRTLYWLNAHALDWVWPQPATPAEVQSFYAHSPP